MISFVLNAGWKTITIILLNAKTKKTMAIIMVMRFHRDNKIVAILQ